MSVRIASHHRWIRGATALALAGGVATAVCGCGDDAAKTMSLQPAAALQPTTVAPSPSSNRSPEPEPGAQPASLVHGSGHHVVTESAPAPSWAVTSPTPDATLGSAGPTPSATPSGTSDPSPSPLISASASASTSVAPAPSPTVSGTQDWAVYPFSATAPANRPIASTAAFESSSGAMTTGLRNTGAGNVNSARWSFALYSTTASDPIVTVRDPSSGVVRASIHLPAAATTSGGTDLHMGVVQPDGHSAFEFYKMTKVSATEWTSTYVVQTDLRGTGLDGGTRASGTSIFWGVIRSEELRDASIRHTLAMAIPATALRYGPVWPARMQDRNASSTYSGAIPMGSFFAIPRGVDVTTLGLGREGLALARALQNYGAYVMLQSASPVLYAQYGADSAQVDELKPAWEKLRPLLRAVTNNAP